MMYVQPVVRPREIFEYILTIQRGEITDPPVEATAAATAPPLDYLRSRSTTPVMSAPPESPFCETCERNQLLLNKTLAEYIPDEDDPEYDKYINTVDEYRAELEERYPQVCENCIGRVEEQIRASGYAAKADNLRRVLEKNKQYQATLQTSRQFWTLAIVRLAKWIYVTNVLVALVWHGFGSIVLANGYIHHFSWRTCFNQAVGSKQVDEACFSSPYMLELARYALVADLLTIWWNPKLEQKTNRAGGRMRGLLVTWFLRIALLAIRFLNFLGTEEVPSNDEGLRGLHYSHITIFVILLLGTFGSWNSVRIVYRSNKSLFQNLDAQLPSAEKPKRSESAKSLPNNSAFDTMAGAFTSSFNSMTGPAQNPPMPPSPTQSLKSTTTLDSDSFTPRRKTTQVADDVMDWTPTQKRFAPHAPSIISPQWSGEPSSPRTYAPAREPVSIFARKDPNPFHHRVPAAPKAPAASILEPWKRAIWTPGLKGTQQNFFAEDREENDERGRGLQGVGVPRNVQRDAELFEPAKLKYDFFGEMKETGLEEGFNGLFKK
jgi:hypothetical protein